MNSKSRTIAKPIVLIILILCLTLCLADFTADRIFYNPYRDFNTTSSTFTILNQLFSPTLTESYVDPNAGEGFLNFGCHSQGFRLLKFSYVHNPYELQNTGKITYRFGKATLEGYTDKLQVGDLTCQQSVFLSSSGAEDYWDSISDDQAYKVWVAFEHPVDNIVFTEKYGWLLDNNTSRPRQCGISWIPVQTSDKSEDICLGLFGNLSFHYLNPYNTFAEHNFYEMDLHGRETIFNGALNYLIEHPKETNLFISTGLWLNGETVNFKDRFDYIQENGIQYLGFVAYMRGSELRTLEKDSITIVRLSED